MDLSSINWLLLLASLMVASTPILLAGIGELVVEKAGVLNLGVEGMMITGAIAGFAVTIEAGSPFLGFLGAAAAGALLSMLFAVLTQFALANQVASGLALTLFGLGLSSLMGQNYVGLRPPSTPKLDIPLLSDIPVLGFSRVPERLSLDAAVVARATGGVLLPVVETPDTVRFDRGIEPDSELSTEPATEPATETATVRPAEDRA